MLDLAERLSARVEGDVMLDAFSRGRYATDASFYQMMPLGVLCPKSEDDILAAIDIARENGIPILPRGGGTSQCGQTVNEALVLDNTQHFNKILEIDIENMRCVVQPGIVLDELNRALKPHGVWFPVDVSTASRATIGGMTGNNSCGGKSIRYGTMRDNVRSIDASPGGRHCKCIFGPVSPNELAATRFKRTPTSSPTCWHLGAEGSGRDFAERFPEASCAGSAATTSMRWFQGQHRRTIWRTCLSDRKAPSPIPPRSS